MTRKILVVVAAAVLAGTAVAVALLHRGGGHAVPSLQVTVGRETHELPIGTRLTQAVARFHLQARAGNLVDVDGRVLHRGAYPGRILVNGKPAPAHRRLHSGDRIGVADGRDRREPLNRQAVNVIGGLPPNPQFTLARAEGTATVVRGAISHKLVTTHLHLTRGESTVAPQVALTFDDGPSPLYTPRILAVLRRLHAQATFFAVGYLAEWYPDVIRAEVAAGMDVGNHSYNHPEVPPFDRLPPRLRDDEIELSARSLRAAGAAPTLFRPPGGSVSRPVVQAAAHEGERVVLWSVDPGDWKRGATPRQIVRNVLSAVGPGSIVLLHDGGGDRSATVAALPMLIEGIRRRGLTLVTTDGF